MASSAEYWIGAHLIMLREYELKRLGALSQRDDFGPGLEFVEVIRPLLHHLAPFGQVCRAIVGASVRIAHGVGNFMS